MPTAVRVRPPSEDLPAAYRSAPLPRWHPATLHAALWAARQVRATRQRLPADGLEAVVPDPPLLPPGATRGVLGVLRRRPATCLERSLVLQRWLAAHGEPYDVVVGVTNEDGVKAHAWLPFEAGRATEAFTEITRVPPRG